MFRLRVRPNRPFALAIALALCLVPLSILLVTLSSAQAGPASGVLDLAQGTGIVRVDPAVTTVQNGETFRIYIMIYSAENLGGFQFRLDYDPIVLEVPKQTNPMILGGFIGSTGRTPLEVINELEPVGGTISYAVITTGSSPGANGEGVLAFVDLRARALGSSALDLGEVEVVDTGGRQQTMSTGDGRVVVVASPAPGQVSIEKGVDSPTVLPEGVLSFTLDRSLTLAGGHTFEEIVYDPIPGGTSYLDGSATLNGIPAPELYSETLDAIYYQNSGSFTGSDQWAIGFQVEVGALPLGTVVVNTVTETVSFDGASFTGPYSDTAESTVFNNPPHEPGNPSPPDGATGVSTAATLGWTGGDPDPGHTVTYDVYFAADDPTPNTLICDDTPVLTCDPGTLANGTHYYWYVVATDNYGASTTGATWDFTTNRPPHEPGNPSPPDGATGVSTAANLNWTGGDPDPGDTVTYDVYFAAGDPTPNTLICNDTPAPACDPGTLGYDTLYYWYVVATDNHGASTTGPTWDFRTGTEPNRPPFSPSDPAPPDGAVDVPTTANLSWTGGDPDPGDTVTYDVYFAANDSTPNDLICNDSPTPDCDPGTLVNGTHYYWYVIAIDNHSASTSSPTWDFTTVCPLPGTPNLVAPANGSSTEDTRPAFDWSPVGGATSYRLQVDDNSSFISPEIDTTTTTSSYTPSSPLSLGTQHWHVQAIDSCGDSDWSQTWRVDIVTRLYLPVTLRNVQN